MRHIVVAAVAAMLVAACGGDFEESDPTETMCDEFAAFVQDGMPREERAGIARRLTDMRAGAKPRVAAETATLVRMAERSDWGWQIAADAFAQACFDVGWDG